MKNNSSGDARFYERCGPFNIAQVAEAAGAAGVVSDLMLTGVAPLQIAGPGEVSFIDHARHSALLQTTRAGAIIVPPDLQCFVPAGAASLVVKSSPEAWAQVAKLFHPRVPLKAGRHSTAFVAETAVVCATAEIGPFAYVGEHVHIGARCRIGAHATIDDGVMMGEDCRIGANSTVSHALLGDRVCLYPGVRIGQEGFALTRTRNGLLPIPQLGRVLIGDDVEIGANAAIDRGAILDTVIGAGSCLDNLVHIAHNVQLGRCCVITAQVGLAGSVVLEDFVQIGGQAGIAGHLTIGAGAQIGAQAGIISDVPPRAVMMGTPAQPRGQFFRQVATLKRLAAGPRGAKD